MISNIELARDYVDLWKKELRIQDWSITVKVGHGKDYIAKTNAFGYDQDDITLIQNRKATIWVNFKHIKDEKDLRKVMLHELLHIMLSGIVRAPEDSHDGSVYENEVERVINSLEEAISRNTKGVI